MQLARLYPVVFKLAWFFEAGSAFTARRFWFEAEWLVLGSSLPFCLVCATRGVGAGSPTGGRDSHAGGAGLPGARGGAREGEGQDGQAHQGEAPPFRPILGSPGLSGAHYGAETEQQQTS